MAKISEALRKKLLNQKKEMGSKGAIIAKKEWTKGRVRLLPCQDELPGRRVVSYYCESLQRDRKGTVSPETFGMLCPVAEAFKELWKDEDKETRDRARETVRTSVEYFVPCVVRGSEGTPEAPNIQIFPFGKRAYERIQDFVLDEDVPDPDITHPTEGRDLLVKKQGQKLETVWTVDKLDPSPLHKDKAMRAALLAAAEKFDVDEHIGAIDWDVLAEMYEALLGKKMPSSYRTSKKAKPAAKSHDEDADGTDGESESAERSDESSDEIVKGSRVSFADADNNTIEGTVTALDDGTATVTDDEDGEWEVEVTLLTLVAADGDDGEAGDGAEEAAEAGVEEDPEIVKGSRVSFDNDGDTVVPTVTKLKGDNATVTDDEDGEWEVDVSLLTLAEDETNEAGDDGEADGSGEEDEAEEAPPKVTRKAPPKPAPKPKADEDEAPPSRKTVARKPAAKPAAKAAEKIRKAGRK